MKQLLLSMRTDLSILACLENGVLNDLVVEPSEEKDIVGRVYKGIIKNVVPSLNGMFVDIGIGRNAFLRTRDTLPEQAHTEGASILVQVEKDSTETKGPLVTEMVSFAGKYAVALWGSDYIGISKKIRNEEVRKHLKEYAGEIRPAGFGLIVRTAAENITENVFKRDLSSLRHMAEIVTKRFNLEKGPCLLYRDGDLAVRTIRDYFSEDVDVLLVDDQKTWERLSSMAQDESLKLADKIKRYDDNESLLKKFHVEEQIDELFQRVVSLKSGGSLIIDYTEALTVIDVNSGSFKGKNIPHEQLAFLINKSAAFEIASQIRLRGLGGSLIIDFIDMKNQTEKEELIHILQSEVSKDRIKTVVCGMTSLGLVEMTRKRTSHRLWENFFDTCPHCRGSGKVLSVRAAADRIIKDLESRRKEGPFKDDIEIRCNKDVADFLNSETLKSIVSDIVGHDVSLKGDSLFDRGTYSILLQ